jgi:hypothetical protein
MWFYNPFPYIVVLKKILETFGAIEQSLLFLFGTHTYGTAVHEGSKTFYGNQ